MKRPHLIARTLILWSLSLSILLSAQAQRNNIREPVPPPANVRRAFDLDSFYQQWIDVRGFPVLASVQVSPYAVKEAAYLIHRMIGHRRDILQTFARNKERFSIVGYDQGITQIPEYSYLQPNFYVDIRARGFGSAEANLTTSTSEENLLHYPGDPYFGFSVLFHELAHAVHERGLNKMDPGFDARLRILYEAAMTKGLWENTYAAVNHKEYWAEASEAWFNPRTTSSFNRFGDTREDLKAYDPEVAALITEVYGDGEWRYTSPKTRLRQQHLQGFAPQNSPTFRWPPDKIALHKIFTSAPESTGDGRWVNLQAYPPSELPRLQASIREGDPTTIAIGNYGVDDVFMYEVPVYGVEWAHGRLRQDMTSRETRVGRLWLLKDGDGNVLSVYRAEAELGRVLILPEGVLADSEEEGVQTDIEEVDNSPRVKMPDANLAAAVRRELGLDANIRITRRVMKRLATLHAPEQQIKNLKGLEYATGLVRLDLWENQIQNVNPLSNLKQLQQLHLQANRIRNIKAFAGLTELRHLHLWGNQIRDISALRGLTKLESLWLTGNPIQDISPLHSLLKQNPDMELDIEIVQSEPIVHVGSEKRLPMYWIDAEAGTLHRLVGTEVESFVPEVRNAISLTVETTKGKIYWTEKIGKNTGNVKSANLDGSNVQVVTTLKTAVPTSIAVDAARSKLYWSNSRGRIQRANLNGRSIQNLLQNLNNPGNITLDPVGGKLYWTEAPGRLRRANLNGKNVQNIASGLEPISDIAVSGNKIYWVENTGNSSGKIGHANLNGSNFGTLVRFRYAPLSIAIDPVGNKIYWTDTGGNIRRANLNAKGVQKIVTGLPGPANLALGSLSAMPAAARLNSTLGSWQTAIPNTTRLLANYPNPFNPETWIPYQLAKSAEVTVFIYSIDGQLVRTLALGPLSAGVYQSRSRAAYWDGKNKLGETVASGVYFYTLETGNFTTTRKMLIRK